MDGYLDQQVPYTLANVRMDKLSVLLQCFSVVFFWGGGEFLAWCLNVLGRPGLYLSALRLASAPRQQPCERDRKLVLAPL